MPWRISILFLMLMTNVWSQGIVGEMYYEPLENRWIDHYLRNDTILIDSVRKTSDVLTNYWDSTYQGMPLSKRRKAVVRHVKHLTEWIEFYAGPNPKIDDSSRAKLTELEWIFRSYLDKSYQGLNSDVTFKDKVGMLRATMRSGREMVYYKTDQISMPSNDGYFWNHVEGKPYKRFGDMADQKKIDTDDPMVVIFDKFSHDGSAPKVKTMDTDLDNAWSLKWGDEVHSDVVGSRLFAALGFDVDHPYYFGERELYLILDSTAGAGTWEHLRDSILEIYDVDLTPFFLSEGIIDTALARQHRKFAPYVGHHYVTFRECALEGRPDRVKRLGSFSPWEMGNADRTELKGALLAHVWIDNWDVREQNTLLTTVHDGNYHYRVSAVFSDLGTSMGVKLSPLRGDFKVGLVNEFGWIAAKRRGNKVRLKGKVNAWLPPYEIANYADLSWMAVQIASVDSLTLRKCLDKSGWPPEVRELYFHKLASRRASILEAFEIDDPHPIAFDRKLNYGLQPKFAVKNGKLKRKYKDHPEGLRGRKGRMRNYGN